MLSSVDPKFKPWKAVKSEFEKVDLEDIAAVDSPRRRDASLCLTHGFHHQKTYSFRDGIRCLAYRSGPVSEEFIINHGSGPANILNLKTFRKDAVSSPASTYDKQNGSTQKDEGFRKQFPLNSPPLQHLVWVTKHRFFVGIGSDKNLRVFSDTLHRCQTLSAPTCCTMPVLAMVYLEQTDEVVTAGIGVVQPWKIRLSNNVKTSNDTNKSSSMTVPNTNKGNNQQGKRERRNSLKTTGMSGMKPKAFGQGRQMLQACSPYQCDLNRSEWVVDLKVYTGQGVPGSVFRNSKHILIATCADSIVAIDYVKRKQIWILRLESSVPSSLHIGENALYNVKKASSSKAVIENSESNGNVNSYSICGHVSLTRCDFFPHSGYFITAGGEGEIHIMNMVNFGLVTVLCGHRTAVTGLIAHTQYPILISSSRDGCIRVWCLETFRETQRIDTGHHIEHMSLSHNPNYFYYYSRQKVSVYMFHNMHFLFSIPHSTPAKLCRIEGDEDSSFPGKILAPLEDGAVAVMSPVTGLMLTMIYPMTSFQIFMDVSFDIYSRMCYIRLQNGAVMQCDCATNPCTPLQCYQPTIPYDEDVCSIAAVRIHFADNVASTTAVLGGLRNGQITLIRPNSFKMNNVQAHAGTVRFLLTIPIDNWMPSQGQDIYCKEQLISIGASSVRTWNVDVHRMENSKVESIHPCHNKRSTMTFSLKPLAKVLLPNQVLHPTMVAALQDRVCIATVDGQIFVLECNNQSSRTTRSLTFMDEKFKKDDILKLTLAERFVIEEAIDKQRKSTHLTHPTFETIQMLKKQSVHLHTHHQEDGHNGTITALGSSYELRLFVSSSDDGYVKLWDDKNRLLRELCFAPNPVTSVCFANGRDLVVGLEGRINGVECATFLTKQMILEREIAKTNFADDINEAALSYDDDLRIISDLNVLPVVPLSATKRPHISDCEADANAKKTVLGKQYISLRTMNDTLAKFMKNEKAQEFLKSLMNRGQEGKKNIEENIDEENKDEIKWRELCTKVRLKMKRGSITDFADGRSGPEFMMRRKRRLFDQGDQKNIAEFLNKIVSPESKLQVREASPQDLKTSLEDGAKPVVTETRAPEIDIVENKFPVAPDGYIPNSVVRIRVNPPPPIIINIPWKLKNAPEGELPWNLLLEETEDEEYTLDFNYENSLDSLNLGSYSSLPSLDSFDRNASMEEEDHDLDADSYYLDEDDNFVPYQRQKGTGKHVSKITFRKLGNTMAEADKEEYHAVEEKKRFPRTPINQSATSRPVFSATQKTDDIGEEIILEESKSSEIVQNVEPQAVIKPQTKFAPPALRNKPDLKAQLLKQRAQATSPKAEVVVIHPLLEEITKALWFRKKMTKITVDTVVEALLELGDTSRVVAHQNVCGSLVRIVKTFGPHGTDLDTSTGNCLSYETIQRMYDFIASFLNPLFRSSEFESSQESDTEYIKEMKKKNPNRVALANNALDALNEDIGISDNIICGMMKLSADENQGLRRRSMKVLKDKLNIDSWEKLEEKMKELVGEEIIESPESHIENQKEVFHGILDRLEQGLIKISEIPRLAEKLHIEIPAHEEIAIESTSSTRTDAGSSPKWSKDSKSESKITSSIFSHKDKSSSSIQSVKAEGKTESTESLASGDTKLKQEELKPKRETSNTTKKKSAEKEQPTRILSGGREIAPRAKINWRKAIPIETQKIIKMMKLMRTVNAVAKQATNKEDSTARRKSNRDEEIKWTDSAKQATNEEDSAARRKSNRDEEIKWTDGGSDDSLFENPAITPSSTLSGYSDADDATDIAQYRLPAIGRIIEMSLATISDTTNSNYSVTNRSSTDGQFDSALGGSLPTGIHQSTTEQQSIKYHSTSHTTGHRNEYRSSDGTTHISGSTKYTFDIDNSWKSSLKKLKQLRESPLKHRYDVGGDSQTTDSKRVKLPPIICKQQRQEYSTENTPGQRLVTEYSLNKSSDSKSQSDRTIVVPLHGRIGTETYTKSGETRYGVLSVKWTNRDVLPEIVETYERNKRSPYKIAQQQNTQRPRNLNSFESFDEKTQSYFGQALPTPTTNNLMWSREGKSFDQRPLSLYQINSKSMKKLLKSARKLSRRKLLMFPKITDTAQITGRKSITVRIPSVLSGTPFDITD